ncbi:RHS repeat domain-containing protein [Flavobacterium microcysteis]|uniref:RHS repeat domain-containing protein n=1 Tax=Flavobacterium microcysteis TaxID=2596891 RepID=UPI001315624B|nr:RHS repeat-associated core domain-containing protein [Flavobacterium microcysteis]
MDYLDGFQYKDGNLQFFPTPEGYIRATDVSGTIAYSYVYNYTDHLGNIRLSYAKDTENPNVLKILEEDHYYPFGLKHTNYNSDLLVHREYRGALSIKDPVTPEPLVPVLPYNYKYNGKELQDELGLNMYDMEARNYMPDIGRWGNMDELSEVFSDLTPYNFSNNNPISFSDPSGLAPEKYNNDDSYMRSGSNYFTSTFVNKNSGRIVEHGDDGDDNIYLIDNDWKRGGSKEGLSILGKEIRGMSYERGMSIRIMEDGAGLPYFANTGAVTPIGGAFDITGAWEALFTELFSGDDSEATAFAMAVVTKGKVKPKLGIRALNGLTINGFGKHSLNRAIGDFARKGVKPNSILDALKRPLVVKDVVTDGLGRQSQRFIGRTGEVVVNPSTGKIISVNPTSTSKATKLINKLNTP